MRPWSMPQATEHLNSYVPGVFARNSIVVSLPFLSFQTSLPCGDVNSRPGLAEESAPAGITAVLNPWSRSIAVIFNWTFVPALTSTLEGENWYFFAVIWMTWTL